MVLNGIRLTYSFIAWMLLLSLHIGSAQAEESYKIVVHPGVSQQPLSKSTLRIIFGMRLREWPDDTPIKVFVLPDDHPTHINFSKEILNIFPYQLRSAWDRLTFSGTGQAPMELNSENEMRTKVATTPGAIGYLRGAMINDQIRALQVK